MNWSMILSAALAVAKQYYPPFAITEDLIKGIALAKADAENSALPEGQQLTREQVTLELDQVVAESAVIIAAARADRARAEADQAAEAAPPDGE